MGSGVFRELTWLTPERIEWLLFLGWLLSMGAPVAVVELVSFLKAITSSSSYWGCGVFSRL
jgi:hypothetical protein